MNGITGKPDPNKWLDLYGDLMYQYTLPRVKDKESAEDLVQETLLAGLNGLSNYKEIASEKNWLFAILKNKIIDYYRKKPSKQNVVSLSDLQNSRDDWFNEAGHWIENKSNSQWHSSVDPAEIKELQQIINNCKGHLKDIQQDVFTLKYLEDVESEEICKVLNISTSNYWVLLHRARLNMRDCIEKNWLKT